MRKVIPKPPPLPNTARRPQVAPKRRGRDLSLPGLEAWLGLLQAESVVVRVLEEELQAQVGIPLAWFEVLLQLNAADNGRLRMNDLAHGLVISRSGVTRLIDRIVEAGMVTRASCASDRRVIHVAITDKGRSTLDQALPVHARAIHDAFIQHLDEAELQAMLAPLKRIIEANGFSALPCAVPKNVAPGSLTAKDAS